MLKARTIGQDIWHDGRNPRIQAAEDSEVPALPIVRQKCALNGR